MTSSLLPMRAPITEWGADLDVFQTYCLSDHELFIGTAYVEIPMRVGVGAIEFSTVLTISMQ